MFAKNTPTSLWVLKLAQHEFDNGKFLRYRLKSLNFNFQGHFNFARKH